MNTHTQPSLGLFLDSSHGLFGVVCADREKSGGPPDPAMMFTLEELRGMTAGVAGKVGRACRAPAPVSCAPAPVSCAAAHTVPCTKLS